MMKQSTAIMLLCGIKDVTGRMFLFQIKITYCILSSSRTDSICLPYGKSALDRRLLEAPFFTKSCRFPCPVHRLGYPADE